MTATAVRFVIPELPPGTPAGTLFLTGDHRGWSSDPQGWAFQRTGQGAVLNADLPMGSLLSVKVRILGTDGRVTEEGDAWGGRAPAHKAVIHEDGQTVTLSLAGWQDDRQGRGDRHVPAHRARNLRWPLPGGNSWCGCGGPKAPRTSCRC
ncbi:hypothetical protein [Deinococcus cavernae]|uniref:hypothetical protein n=1 Tax=Deinococcus cavernae TaxID=2320857 RepID=UPI001F33CEC2|nr:hypothetical protein [Deinococcus cavernae]